MVLCRTCTCNNRNSKRCAYKLNTVKGECTTPTGAAIIKTLCDDFVDVLELEVKQIGYGIGHKKFEIPNMLRTVLGVKKKKNLYMR